MSTQENTSGEKLLLSFSLCDVLPAPHLPGAVTRMWSGLVCYLTGVKTGIEIWAEGGPHVPVAEQGALKISYLNCFSFRGSDLSMEALPGEECLIHRYRKSRETTKTQKQSGLIVCCCLHFQGNHGSH